jgi:hypothetical protein
MNIKLLHFLLLFVLLSLIIRVKDDRVFVRVKGLWSGRGEWEREGRGDLVYAEGEWVV